MKFKNNAIFLYHLIVIILYLIIIPLILIFARRTFDYHFSYNNFLWVISIIGFSIIGFFYLFRKEINFNKDKFRNYKILLVVIYAMIFGFSEELIFRGLIQGFFNIYFKNILICILLSSAIFGLAHLLNGAKSFHVKEWNWKFAFIAFLAGLPLGALFALTGSLLMPCVLHVILILCLQLFKE
jgi:membrane protease YdiL (CAAX protease family)